MSERINEEASDLISTILICYFIHSSGKGDQVRECAKRLLKRARCNEAIEHMSAISCMNNKSIHYLVNNLVGSGKE